MNKTLPLRHLLALPLLACSALSAHAVTDPSGPLLPSFTGTAVPGLDIVQADVSFDAAAQTFTFSAQAAGPLAAAAKGGFVFGLDRGGAVNSPFGPIGFPGVAFNATAVLKTDGTGNAGATTFSTRVQGDHLSAVLPASLFPSLGRDPKDYSWALWSVDLAVTGLPRNADFLGTGNLPVTAAVPEPATVSLLLAGLGAVGFVARRQKRAAEVD